MSWLFLCSESCYISFTILGSCNVLSIHVLRILLHFIYYLRIMGALSTRVQNHVIFHLQFKDHGCIRYSYAQNLVTFHLQF